MGKIAKFDSGAGGAAYAAIDLGADQDEVWVEFRMWSDDTAVSAQTQSVWMWANGDYPGPTTLWAAGVGPDPGPGANGPIVVEWHYANSGDLFEVYHDGVLIQSGSTGSPGDVRTIALIFPDPTDYGPLGVVWVDDVNIGTTRHGTDLFSDDFEGGTFAAWTATAGDATIVDNPFLLITPSSSVGRVMIAPGDGPLVWEPTWVCVDYYDNLVQRFDIRRGRQTEFDTTDTSTATVWLNDHNGYFDPQNTGSPFYGYDGKQIKLQVWDPVACEWVQQFRGWIDEATFDFSPATAIDPVAGISINANVQLRCVDIFEMLTNIEFDLTGAFGDPPPVGHEHQVFYEDGPFDTRVTAILNDCGLTTDWYVVFSGNVDVLEGLYDPSESPLTAIRDAVDAEFPGLANCFSDKRGRFCAHGRRARFEPDAVAGSAGPDAWNFRRWKAADGANQTDASWAQIRPPLGWVRSRSRIRNVGWAWPADIKEADKQGQFSSDSTSIGNFQRRPWSAENLLLKRGTTTGNNGNDEAKLFADFYVANYADIRTRLEQLTLKSIPTSHSQGAATWAMLLGADISDVVTVNHSYPGGSYIGEDFYVEGMEMTVEPLNEYMDFVECTFNVSPTAYYGNAVGMLDA